MGEVTVEPRAAGHSVASDGELIVSTLLRYGVLISLALVALGVVLLFAAGSTGYGQGLELQGLLSAEGAPAGAWPQTLGAVLSGVLAGRPYALILLGLLLLIATPVLRVAVSVVLFALERDYLYVGITLFVLAVLALSFFLGKVE
jgi:uncharacterized membrane protein